MTCRRNATAASEILQQHLYELEEWHRKLWPNINEAKSVQVTFATNMNTCFPFEMFEKDIPVDKNSIYLGLFLDQLLTWKHHLQNKLTICKAIFKPIWTCGIQFFGCAKKSNIKIIQRLQSKMSSSLINKPISPSIMNWKYRLSKKKILQKIPPENRTH